MRRNLMLPAVLYLIASVAVAAPVSAQPATNAGSYSMEQVKSYPFPNELAASPTGARIAWAMNEEGRRNLYVAEAPGWQVRRLTSYERDDGQQIARVQFSPDGEWVVFRRGGDDANWDEDEWGTAGVNPLSLPEQPTIQLMSIPFAGGEPRVLAEHVDGISIAPDSRRVLYERSRQIWSVPIDGSEAGEQMFFARGVNGDAHYSPDGSMLAFISRRNTHSYIGIYTDDDTPIRWLDPTTNRDMSPRWSPDGRRIAYVRRPGGGGPPSSSLVRSHQPWQIRIVDVTTGESRELWRAPETLEGSPSSTQGSTNLHYADGRVVFMSYQDGWPHLYSVPENGGDALLLTPGDYMAEYIRMTPDRRSMLFTANAGDTDGDIDRRHIVRVPVDRAQPEVLTPGTGLEWTPVMTGDRSTIAYISATAQRPPLPTVMPASGGDARLIAEDRIPADFPMQQLVTPRSVTFTAADGETVYAQLFERDGGPAQKPAVIFIHGGPQRQMLSGWHYSDYYSNAYAAQQYFASRGYVALSVNFRLGIGYGYDFHQPPEGGARGASEYRDVVAAGEYLQSLPQVDDSRIGVWGGSYGGFLTAMALARDSDMFAAGVDIHGVHNWADRYVGAQSRYEPTPDADRMPDIAWASSPVAYMDTWRSPVLLIHGDDDRNVRFSDTVDLARRLELHDVPFEELIIPDDTHHFMRHANWVRVNQATFDFLHRHLAR